MASLDTVKANLDIAAINRAVDLLTQAKDLFLRPRRLRGGGARRDEQIFRFNIRWSTSMTSSCSA